MPIAVDDLDMTSKENLINDLAYTGGFLATGFTSNPPYIQLAGSLTGIKKALAVLKVGHFEEAADMSRSKDSSARDEWKSEYSLYITPRDGLVEFAHDLLRHYDHMTDFNDKQKWVEWTLRAAEKWHESNQHRHP
jgi:hypothetical protein